jgi:hypothetical protein
MGGIGTVGDVRVCVQLFIEGGIEFFIIWLYGFFFYQGIQCFIVKTCDTSDRDSFFAAWVIGDQAKSCIAQLGYRAIKFSKNI